MAAKSVPHTPSATLWVEPRGGFRDWQTSRIADFTLRAASAATPPGMHP